jgi:tetratricopeptide (TPR) repeat protein
MLLTAIVFIPLLAFGQAAETSDDLHTVYANLKAAEEKKDTDAIKKWATEASRQARSIIQSTAPADAAEAASHQARVDFARQVEAYADYSLYVAALRAPDAAQRIELFELLEQQTPKSDYVPQLYSLYGGALAQTGQQTKLLQFAEKGIARDPNNEDLLAILADGALARKQWERAATFASRLTSVMSSHPRPEGLPVGDWERKRSALLRSGYYIAGIAYAAVNKYPQADKNLRAALPMIKGDDQMTAAALFHLGVANYNLARVTHNKPQMREAVAFSEECGKIRSAFQDQAIKNAWGMKQEMDRMR